MIHHTTTKINKCQRNRKYIFDVDFFEKIDNEQKSYWLGFVYADGSVYSDGYKSHHITIKLSSKDIDHLRKFQNDVRSDHNIKIRKTRHVFPSGKEGTFESCTLRMCSKKMFQDLVNVGCFPNKSLYLRFPSDNILPNHLTSHFMRGYFDGDGSISITNCNKQKQFTVLGTKEFLTCFQNILCEKCLISKTKIYKKDKIYCLIYGGNKNISKIKDFLYKDSVTWLDRKKKIFEIDSPIRNFFEKNNPSYDHKIYTFKNINNNIIFTGTQFDFKQTFNIKNVWKILSGQRKKQNGWILL